jgi:hypothetical protein
MGGAPGHHFFYTVSLDWAVTVRTVSCDRSRQSDVFALVTAHTAQEVVDLRAVLNPPFGWHFRELRDAELEPAYNSAFSMSGSCLSSLE